MKQFAKWLMCCGYSEAEAKFEVIVKWLMSCGYSEIEAKFEANKMIERNRRDGYELAPREYAISIIFADLVDAE